jgi:aryl carrier-like protein
LVEQIREIAPGCSILNHYGPTETTVGVLTHPVRDGRLVGGTVPVGRPLADTTAHVLGRDLILVPPGAVGEILIGGRQVSRGYLGHPDVTASRFLPDPFASEPGARLYRTGDLGCRLPDGSIEFLGRADHQVKIRGFRVEPGEIEATLRMYAPVRQALVVPHQQNGSGPRLVAYLTVNGAKPTLRDLRDHATRSLPDYMVPSAFVLLDAFPLTGNGKIDRQALPDPEVAGFRLAGERVAPRNRTEEILASIWCETLGLAEIGIHDNFFDLGGDSILIIRVAAKANQAGVRLVPRQFFERQTIAALAEVAGALPEIEAEQEWITGPVPLTPIQCLFFEQELAEPHHWNQSMMLELHRSADAARLDAVVHRLVEHHDALRLRFLREGSAWRQYNSAPDGSAPFTCIDLAALPDEMWRPALEQAADHVQRSLDLRAGPLLRVVLLDRGSRGSSRLLLVVHHLAIDGVSWDVLLEELARGYEQLSSTVPPPRRRRGSLPIGCACPRAGGCCWPRSRSLGVASRRQAM